MAKGNEICNCEMNAENGLIPSAYVEKSQQPSLLETAEESFADNLNKTTGKSFHENSPNEKNSNSEKTVKTPDDDADDDNEIEKDKDTNLSSDILKTNNYTHENDKKETETEVKRETLLLDSVDVEKEMKETKNDDSEDVSLPEVKLESRDDETETEILEIDDSSQIVREIISDLIQNITENFECSSIKSVPADLDVSETFCCDSDDTTLTPENDKITTPENCTNVKEETMNSNESENPSSPSINDNNCCKETIEEEKGKI